MNPLPSNICRHPDGYLVRVQRGGVLYQAFTTELERAVFLRDRFLRLAGPLKPRHTPHTRARSNTGVVGVTETTHWRAHRSYPCFMVSWHEAGRHCTKRIYIQRGQRDPAFQRACALRAAAVGRDAFHRVPDPSPEVTRA